MKITFIGGGNMATALAGGLIKRGQAAKDIRVVEPDAAARRRIRKLGVTVLERSDAKALAGARLVVLAVKPQQMREAARALAPLLEGRLVVSIAAGIRLADLRRWLGGHRALVRCMPNTPALIGAGISGLYAPAGVSAAARRSAERVLAAVGKTVWLRHERLLDPVTAVSASSPAYVFWFVEQLAAAGVDLGLPQDVSMKLAKEAVLGSARLAAESADSPSLLRARVTSKGGTTEAALRVFEEERLAERFRRAVEAASRRGAELGALLGKD
ncbi:MAG: pyrroline-5-carboxylate reductase [Pseudomonadota bacterium]